MVQESQRGDLQKLRRSTSFFYLNLFEGLIFGGAALVGAALLFSIGGTIPVIAGTALGIAAVAGLGSALFTILTEKPRIPGEKTRAKFEDIREARSHSLATALQPEQSVGKNDLSTTGKNWAAAITPQSTDLSR